MKSKEAAVQQVVQKVVVFLAVLVVLPVSASWATNYSFVPGDAFFSATLTQKDVDAFPPGDEPIEFHYRSPGSGYFCGFAGFEVLRLEGKTSEIKSRLASTYKKLREKHPATLSTIEEEDGTETKFEDNGLAVFIYNRDVDWTKQRLAIRYNEDWFNPPESALRAAGRNDYDPKYARHYDTFVESVEAVAEDWKYSTAYPGLRVGVPDNAGWAAPGDRLLTPVRAKVADVQFIIVAQDSEQRRIRLFERKEGNSFVTVDANGVSTVDWKGGKPVVEVWPEAVDSLTRKTNGDANEAADSTPAAEQ
jgi:hypothetical protein